MSEIKDGGPAFAAKVWQTDMSGSNWSTASEVNWPGMSLRDWFAGQALAGMCGGEPGAHLIPDAAAFGAYEYADAMLRAREGK
jgi:hypothetical protein